MSDEALYTLKQLAEQLGLPESTIRYYRDAFLDHIPSVGSGRRRRYPAQSVAVLRSIAKSYSEGRSRAEIIAAIHGPGARAQAVASVPEKAQRTVPLEEVSNLDLLAAILDGEREQRDALWQMAKEIVRLTEVLEDQDKVLHEIADQAGVGISGSPRLSRRPAAQLSAAPEEPAYPEAPEEEPKLRHSLAHEATLRHADAPLPDTPAPLVAPAAQIPITDTVPMSHREEPSPMSDDRHIAEVEPLPRFGAPGSSGGDSDMARLRAELENERALVERLRESKLQLEHRAADAEAALEDRGKRGRPSMIRRLLGSEEK